jgi:BMFP domain-containing protein YqiC
MVFKGRNRDRIGILENRLERLEQQLDQTSKQTAPKQRE